MNKYLCSLLLSILIFASQGAAQIKLPEVRRIDAKMAHLKYKAGRAILVDAMGPKTFAKKHILGSMSLPNDGGQILSELGIWKSLSPKTKKSLSTANEPVKVQVPG